jgi:hypothetical protein
MRVGGQEDPLVARGDVLEMLELEEKRSMAE